MFFIFECQIFNTLLLIFKIASLIFHSRIGHFHPAIRHFYSTIGDFDTLTQFNHGRFLGYFGVGGRVVINPFFVTYTYTTYPGGHPGWIWHNFWSIPPTLGSPKAKVLEDSKVGFSMVPKGPFGTLRNPT